MHGTGGIAIHRIEGIFLAKGNFTVNGDEHIKSSHIFKILPQPLLDGFQIQSGIVIIYYIVRPQFFR